MNRFTDQVAIVTGAARGIGLGIARRLGSEGARLALVDIDAPLVEQAAAGLEAEDPLRGEENHVGVLQGESIDTSEMDSGVSGTDCFKPYVRQCPRCRL